MVADKVDALEMFPDLILKLQERLQKPLPGWESHAKLKPILPHGVRFKEPTEHTRRGGVLLLLYQVNGYWHFPLIQRPMYDGVHSGQVAFPGGKHEPADVDLFATAVRESHEEVGTLPQKVQVIGALSEFYVAASDHLILPVVGYYPEVPQFVPEVREVDHVIEAALHQLFDGEMLKEKEIVASNGYKLRSPYFDIQGKVVWGATAMILSEFMDIIKELD
jgi:8-oxo-dGTP pyrophosphatase MutT (NUDIX family)